MTITSQGRRYTVDDSTPLEHLRLIEEQARLVAESWVRPWEARRGERIREIDLVLLRSETLRSSGSRSTEGKQT